MDKTLFGDLVESMKQHNEIIAGTRKAARGEHFMGFVDSQVKEGRYSNASDVMRAALRLLEEREARLTALRAALIEGRGKRPIDAV